MPLPVGGKNQPANQQTRSSPGLGLYPRVIPLRRPQAACRSLSWCWVKRWLHLWVILGPKTAYVNIKVGFPLHTACGYAFSILFVCDMSMFSQVDASRIRWKALGTRDKQKLNFLRYRRHIGLAGPYFGKSRICKQIQFPFPVCGLSSKLDSILLLMFSNP